MTMRPLVACFFAFQMTFGNLAFADDEPIPHEAVVGEASKISTAPKAPPIPAPPPQRQQPNIPGSSGQAVGNPVVPDCSRQISCSHFLKDLDQDQDGHRMIQEELAANPSRGCAVLTKQAFQQQLFEVYKSKTEAGDPHFCKSCLPKFQSQIGKLSQDGKAIGDALLCQEPEIPRPRPVAPVYVEPEPEVQVEHHRPRERVVEREPDPVPHDSGGGSFMNSNLMWGLGGALLGGLAGYMLGRNSAQNQYQYRMPMWQQIGPRPMPFGQVPGPFGGNPFMNRPGLPQSYPVGSQPFGIGGGMGIGGAPNILPYGGGQYGQPGYNSMMPIGGYQSGYGVGGYGLGTNFGGYGAGFNNFGGGYQAPIYNYGTAPSVLPYR